MADSLEGGRVDARAGMGRRAFLVRATAVGAAAWAVPTIVTMTPAGAAEVTSPPPRPPVTPPSETTVVVDPQVVDPGTQVASKTATQATLPNTGADTARLAAAGLAAIAGGAALTLWSADKKPRHAPALIESRPPPRTSAPD
jgi:hypothetical protein